MLPKLELSILICVFDNQYTHAQFRYTVKPVLDLLVTVSPSQSASTLASIINPISLGAGAFEDFSLIPYT